MAEGRNTITQHQATTDTDIARAYERAIDFATCNNKQLTRDESLLYFGIAFLNRLAHLGLTPDFNETMDKLTWEATERVNNV